MPKKVSLNVKCTHCGTSLMDYKNLLNEKPSILVDVINENGDKGKLRLCSTYGCYDKFSDVALADGTRVGVLCPHCGKKLNTDVPCQTCDNSQANMIKFNIEIGGVVSICDRIGCTNHYVMFEDLTDTLRKFHREYGV